ncbi:F-box protein SKIP23 [Trifolium repens]|nr:F-box protein SKIP23 [Trifolium repens]
MNKGKNELVKPRGGCTQGVSLLFSVPFILLFYLQTLHCVHLLLLVLSSCSSYPNKLLGSFMADWSKLPEELLQLISEKLNCEFYQLRFRSVCSSWRSSSITKNHLLNLPSKFPYPSYLIEFHYGYNYNKIPTYPISKRIIFLINPPPNQQQTLNPWLIKIGPDSHGHTSLWNPLSPDNQLRLRFQLPRHFDFNQLSVFKLGHEFVIGDFPSLIKKVVAYDTLHSGNDRCSVLLAIHLVGKLAIFRSGVELWTIVQPKMPPERYTDVCVFNGRPIAVISTGRTVVVGPDLSLDLVAEAVFGGGTKLLVESDGELLLVDKYTVNVRGDTPFILAAGDGNHYGIIIKRAVRFDVFRLDENEKKWVKLTNLGDRVLFLGKDYSFSVKAKDLCMENGNCIIYRDDDYDGNLHSTGLGIDVFCLDKQQISPLSDLPCCSNLFWPPPQWTEMD